MIRTLQNFLLSRSRKRSPSTIVLHSTIGGSAVSSIEWLRHIGFSYHYIIERDGTIFKCVPLSRVAFHAGTSSGPEGANVNEYSVGIAFANNGDEPYTEAAVEACKSLIGQIRDQYPGLKWLCTHYAITVKPDGSYRKSDPARFDRLQYVSNGLTPWKPSWAKQFALMK